MEAQKLTLQGPFLTLEVHAAIWVVKNGDPRALTANKTQLTADQDVRMQGCAPRSIVKHVVLSFPKQSSH